jgi:hypothetical protein
MAVKWSAVAPYIEHGFATGGQVTRSPIVDAAEDDSAPDAVVDALDGLGSRVFNTVEDAKAFLISQSLVED